jgi:hypothetical protein
VCVVVVVVVGGGGCKGGGGGGVRGHQAQGHASKANHLDWHVTVQHLCAVLHGGGVRQLQPGFAEGIRGKQE